jgi:hypothetical protein
VQIHSEMPKTSGFSSVLDLDYKAIDLQRLIELY